VGDCARAFLVDSDGRTTLLGITEIEACPAAQLADPRHLVFGGTIDPINPVVETASQVRDRVLEAEFFLSKEQLGTTDDCGFAPFADDTSTARDTAFRIIRARVDGAMLAAPELGW
jgi:5-methyltetrahydropteroyltriglutamate--homocysteine methyltransferase